MENGIRKNRTEAPTHWWVEFVESFRMVTYFADQPLHFQIKAQPQLGRDLRLKPNSLGQLGLCCGVYNMLHRPAI